MATMDLLEYYSAHSESHDQPTDLPEEFVKYQQASPMQENHATAALPKGKEQDTRPSLDILPAGRHPYSFYAIPPSSWSTEPATVTKDVSPFPQPFQPQPATEQKGEERPQSVRSSTSTTASRDSMRPLRLHTMSSRYSNVPPKDRAPNVPPKDRGPYTHSRSYSQPMSLQPTQFSPISTTRNAWDDKARVDSPREFYSEKEAVVTNGPPPPPVTQLALSTGTANRTTGRSRTMPPPRRSTLLSGVESISSEPRQQVRTQLRSNSVSVAQGQLPWYQKLHSVTPAADEPSTTTTRPVSSSRTKLSTIEPGWSPLDLQRTNSEPSISTDGRSLRSGQSVSPGEGQKKFLFSIKSKPDKKKVKSVLGERLYQWGIKAGAPLNRMAELLGAEGILPASMDKECDKAARILKSLCRDCAMLPPAPGERTPSSKSAIKIPPHVISQAKGLAIFTTINSGLGVSKSTGTGIVIARLPNSNEWSPPSGFLVHTVGAGLSVGLDIIDSVCILRTEEAVRAFTKPKLRLGGELNITTGPTKSGKLMEGAAGMESDSVWCYQKSHGVFVKMQIDGTVIKQRPDANAAFYGERVSAERILSGDVRCPTGRLAGPENNDGLVMWPKGAKHVMEVLRKAEGRVEKWGL